MNGAWLIVAAFRAELPLGIARGGSVTLQALGRTGAGAAIVQPPVGASALIITGACGALEPGYPPGSLVAPERVVLPGTGMFEPDGPLRDRLLAAAEGAGLGIAQGSLLEASALVDLPGARRELGRAHAASFVDMESAALAMEARRLGLPWAILRFVSDSPEEPLDWLGELLGGMPTKQPSLARVALALTRRPWHARRLVALARSVHAGRRAVGRVVRASRRSQP